MVCRPCSQRTSPARVRTRRGTSHAICCWAVAALALLCAGDVAAAPTTTGFALNRHVAPAPSSDWFRLESLDFRGWTRPGVGLVSDFSYRPLVLRDEAGDEVSRILRYQFYYHLSVDLVVAERLRLAASLPFLLYSLGGRGTLTEVAGVSGVEVSSPDGTGIGDARFDLDLRLVGEYGEPFTLALGARVFAATGQEKFFASDGLPRVAGRMMVAGQAGLFAYAAEAGVVAHVERDDFVAVPFGTDLSFAAALGLRLLDGVVHLGPELHGSTVISDSGDGWWKRATTPVELSFGSKFQLGHGIRLGASAGTALTTGLGAPRVRALASLEWAPPIERRPLSDSLPSLPERDLDGDGVLDELDGCPELSGPARPLERERSGCPDPPDGDGDGIGDELDACPREPGPASSDPKAHGCTPPPDTDRDGVIDSVDACPSVAGIIQSDPAQQGCPPDADRDGIVDSLDACPGLAGEAYDDPKLRGCPRARLEQGAIVINEPVQFAAGSARLLPESDGLLKTIAQLLIRHPEIEHLVVEGHTDSSGNARTNLELSRARAAAVAKWLVANGISAKRVASRGFGSATPVAPNATPEGRARNRRVEFRVLAPGESPVVAPSR